MKRWPVYKKMASLCECSLGLDTISFIESFSTMFTLESRKNCFSLTMPVSSSEMHINMIGLTVTETKKDFLAPSNLSHLRAHAPHMEFKNLFS